MNEQGTTLYRLLRKAGSPFRYRVVGLENVEDAGPAIYVANHLGSVGPVASILSMPVRFYPWAIAEMLDFRRAPRYLYDDFVHPTWHLSGRTGMVVSTLLSQITVRMLNGLGCIAVDSNRGETVSAFRRSLELLLAGRSLLVFPEDAKQPADPETHLHPFQCGFVGLCAMYQRKKGKALPIYPMAVYPESTTIAVGRAVFHQDNGRRRQDVAATCDRLRELVAELYLGLQASR